MTERNGAPDRRSGATGSSACPSARCAWLPAIVAVVRRRHGVGTVVVDAEDLVDLIERVGLGYVVARPRSGGPTGHRCVRVVDGLRLLQGIGLRHVVPGQRARRGTAGDGFV